LNFCCAKWDLPSGKKNLLNFKTYTIWVPVPTVKQTYLKKTFFSIFVFRKQKVFDLLNTFNLDRFSSPSQQISSQVPHCTAELSLATLGKAFEVGGWGLIFLMPKPAAVCIRSGATNAVLTLHALFS
jgi:hypothetical protein